MPPDRGAPPRAGDAQADAGEADPRRPRSWDTGRPVRRRVRTAAPPLLPLVAAVALLAAPAPASPTGTVVGRVVLSARLAARAPRFDLYPDRTPLGRPGPPAPEVSNVIVYLQGPGLDAPTPQGSDEPRVIEQVGESFVPHVLPVVRGTVVAFRNEDPIFHNVFSLSRARTFDLGRYPRPESRSIRFDVAGVVQVFCHIHSDMSAVILVLDNPYFATPEGSGTFRIEGIPPGDYRIVAWHERARPTARDVRVTAGATTREDFDIPVELDDGGR